MANRLTDSRKWDDDWFLELSPQHKLLWLYIIDKCNHAGIYKHSSKLETCCLGCEINWDIALKAFNGRAKLIKENKYFIPKFIEFQYGVLKEDNRCHKSAIEILKTEGVYKGLIRGLKDRIRQDKDKGKEQDKDKDIIDLVIIDLNSTLKASYKKTGEKLRDQIKARLNDGFSLDDFKQVHSKKYAEWNGTDMQKYLRPETLYGTKFESYLNQKDNNARPKSRTDL